MTEAKIAGINIAYKFENSANTRDLFSPYHRKYIVLVYNRDNNNRNRYFTYQCNKDEEPKIEDLLYCLTMDYKSAEWCDSLDLFIKEYGYEDKPEEAERVFKQLQTYAERYSKLFTEEQVEKLIEHFEDY